MIDFSGFVIALLKFCKVEYVVISVFSTALCAIYKTKEIWWLILVFCSTFLLVSFICWGWNRYTTYQKNVKIKKEQNSKCEKEENRKYNMYRNLIKQRFSGLSDEELSNVIKLYQWKIIDAKDKYVRIIRSEDAIKEKISFIQLYVSGANNTTLYCVYCSTTASYTKVVFDPFFYELVEEYLRTKAKA